MMLQATLKSSVLEGDTTAHVGSGNFLADQGVADPDEFRVKSHLCHTIAGILDARGLTQTQVAHLAGEEQPDISKMVNSRHDKISVWRLMKVLTALGVDIGIMINVDSGNERGVIMSHTLEAPEAEMEPAPGMSP